MNPAAHASPTWLPARDPAEAARAVAAAFSEAFGGGGGGGSSDDSSGGGGGPDGVWAAPGRVNLIGEHLDYNGGPVLPLALPHRTVVAVRVREDDAVRLVSASALGEDAARWEGRLPDVGPGSPSGWAAYAAGVLWALREAGHDVPGVDVAVDSAVPIGAGLSSSAALECAVAVALADALGLPTDDAGRAALAAACVRAENEVAGAPTGGMDQAASLRCTPGQAILLDTRDSSVQQVPLDLAPAGLALLVVDTRASHSHSTGGYGDRRAESARAAQALGVEHLAAVADLDDALRRLGGAGTDPDAAEVLRRRTRHVVTETARVREAVALLREERYEAVAPLLSASHASMRDDYEISSPELDTACEAAEAAGALGARMTGGGFGGSAVALVRADDAGRVAAAVHEAAARAGHPQPAFLLAVPSAGAARVA
ncbi:galactokinase [Quadrisphaera sp. DSM 44207]|uniref:galactokinase n=1 Tax=Quadrisphaera sp. DSM 44207 TaxID=1881057 RepID=UPI00088A093A|nr:galactokinase [Quadrisphaera sp. DSM 44207]SDQ12142.1 galactokinase [Quadrisphaera sp. DSM 44207]